MYRDAAVAAPLSSIFSSQIIRVLLELMHMIKKRQLVIGEGNEGRTAAEQFYALAA